MLRGPCFCFCASPAPFPVAGCVACPSSCGAGAGVHPFVFYCVFNFTLFVYFVYLFYACLSLKLSRGVMLFGHMT